MNIGVKNLRKTERKEFTRDGKKHVNIYFECQIEVDGVTKDCTLHAMGDDGSIAKNRGRYYLTAKINEKEADEFRKMEWAKRNFDIYMPCQKCQQTTAVEAAKVLFPLVEKLGRIKLAKWRHGGGWWLFDVLSKPVGENQQTGKTIPMGPECVGIEMQQAQECPFHGRTVYREIEPFD